MCGACSHTRAADGGAPLAGSQFGAWWAGTAVDRGCSTHRWLAGGAAYTAALPCPAPRGNVPQVPAALPPPALQEMMSSRRGSGCQQILLGLALTLLLEAPQAGTCMYFRRVCRGCCSSSAAAGSPTNARLLLFVFELLPGLRKLQLPTPTRAPAGGRLLQQNPPACWDSIRRIASASAPHPKQSWRRMQDMAVRLVGEANRWLAWAAKFIDK